MDVLGCLGIWMGFLAVSTMDLMDFYGFLGNCWCPTFFAPWPRVACQPGMLPLPAPQIIDLMGSYWTPNHWMVLVGGLVAIFDFPIIDILSIYTSTLITTKTSGWWFGCHQFYFPIYKGNVIIPIDELIFFRGVAQPPTRNGLTMVYQCNVVETIISTIPSITIVKGATFTIPSHGWFMALF